MSKPRFIDINGKIYNADSCVPLNDAWKSGEIQLHTLARGSYPGHQLSTKELSGIKSIGFWDSHKSQNWGLDWHRNEGIEICYLESGGLVFEMSKQQFNLKPHDITITRPWLSHKLGNPTISASKLHWIILDLGVRYPHQNWKWPSWIILNKKDLDVLTKFLRHNESPVWESTPEIVSCFVQISLLVTSKENYDTKLKILINSLLMALLDLFQHGKVELNTALIASKRTVKLFLKDLENHLVEEWTLESIANHCNLGNTQVTKYCKEITNLSPMQYLSSLRIKEAAKVLKQYPGKSISEVAYENGFSSPQYFATVFKTFFRKTPLQFREG